MILDFLLLSDKPDGFRTSHRFMFISSIIFIGNLVLMFYLMATHQDNVSIKTLLLPVVAVNIIAYPWLNIFIRKNNFCRKVVYLWAGLFLLETAVLANFFRGIFYHVEVIYGLIIITTGFLLSYRDIIFVTSLTLISYLVPVFMQRWGLVQELDLVKSIYGPSANPSVFFLVVAINTVVIIATGFLTSWTLFFNTMREKRLLRNEEQLRDAQRIARLVSWELDPHTGKVNWSDVIYDLLDTSTHANLSDFRVFLDEYVHPEDVYIFDRILFNPDSQEKVRNYEFRLIMAGGGEKNLRSEVRPVRDRSGKIVLFRGTILDVTDQRSLEKELIHLAHYDDLTNLVNRSLFYRLLVQSMSNAKREGRSLALLFLDLDGFKEINDYYGHDAGDKTLVAVASRMSDTIRENDVAARMGGDEFAIILQNVAGTIDAEFVADKLIEAINLPIDIGSENVGVGVSIGIVLFPEHTLDDSDLIKKADHAMYEAKKQGKNRHVLYSAEGSNSP